MPTRRAAPGNVGAPGRLIIRRPLKPIPLNYFGLGQGWRNILRVRAKTAVNFGRNSFLHAEI